MKHRFSRNGRARAIRQIDMLFNEEKNMATLYDALQAEFDADPMKFFREIIMPLAPREAITQTEAILVKWTPADIVRDMDASTTGEAGAENG